MTTSKTLEVYFQRVLPFFQLPANLSDVSTSNPGRGQSLKVNWSNIHERAKECQGNQEKASLKPKGKKSAQEREAGKQKMIRGLLAS